MIEKLVQTENVEIGSLIALAVMTGAFNLDWRHYSRYWLRGERRTARRLTLIRVVFALGLIGTFAKLIPLLLRTGLDWEKVVAFILDAVIFIAVFAILDLFVRWKLGPPRHR